MCVVNSGGITIARTVVLAGHNIRVMFAQSFIALQNVVKYLVEYIAAQGVLKFVPIKCTKVVDFIFVVSCNKKM